VTIIAVDIPCKNSINIIFTDELLILPLPEQL